MFGVHRFVWVSLIHVRRTINNNAFYTHRAETCVTKASLTCLTQVWIFTLIIAAWVNIRVVSCTCAVPAMIHETDMPTCLRLIHFLCIFTQAEETYRSSHSPYHFRTIRPKTFFTRFLPWTHQPQIISSTFNCISNMHLHSTCKGKGTLANQKSEGNSDFFKTTKIT